MSAAAPLTRLAIVTGGSRGLGRELCAQFEAQGFRPLDFSRSAPHPYSVRIDLARPASSARAVRAALRRIDARALVELVCVSNAGTLDPVGPAARKASAALLANLQVNFVSAIAVIASVIGHFQQVPARKVLVNITSGAAYAPHAGLSLYGAAKAGLEQFVRALALEQAAQAHPFVAINVDPGALDTAMQATLRAAALEDFPEAADFVRRRQRGELAAPATVAAAIVRLARSDALAGGARYRAGDLDETSK